jgi:hypothetical protein
VRDTENQLPLGHQTRPTITLSDTKPTLGMVNEEARRAASLSDGIPGAIRPASPAIPPPPPNDSRKLGDRPSTINAATLPAPRPISRPPARPALSAPQVVSRPLPGDDRNRRESEAVEVYSPPLPSAELPPGERPGQYAQHKKVSGRIPLEGLRDPGAAPRTDGRIEPRPERPDTRPDPRPETRADTRNDGRIERAGVPVPAGLSPPRRPGSSTTAPPRTAAPTGAIPPSAMIGPSGSAPREPAAPRTTEPMRARVPTPSRMSSQTGAPAISRTGTGVVVNRPAMIIGGPAKSAGTVPRIRKAREDEGRGFGQGLISEKSLDEVILAYLSEDADEK